METSKAIKEAHSRGLSNRAIARETGIHWKTVAAWLSKLGLRTNHPRGKPPVSVSEMEAICQRCKNTVLKTDFALIRSIKDGRKLSICRSCRKQKEYDRLSGNSEVFCRMAQGRLKQRAQKQELTFDLPDGFLYNLWNQQKGLCFYTDQPMIQQAGQGLNAMAMSVDKINPHLGYTKNNIVLATKRANSIKLDLSIDELKELIPSWYVRLKNPPSPIL